jgi:hypothetical protein
VEIVFGVTYVLSVQYSCAVVSVFLLWRESQLNMNFLVESEFSSRTYEKKLSVTVYLFLAFYGSTTIQS